MWPASQKELPTPGLEPIFTSSPAALKCYRFKGGQKRLKKIVMLRLSQFVTHYADKKQVGDDCATYT